MYIYDHEMFIPLKFYYVPASHFMSSKATYFEKETKIINFSPGYIAP